jgi:hypothetical protein
MSNTSKYRHARKHASTMIYQFLSPVCFTLEGSLVDVDEVNDWLESDCLRNQLIDLHDFFIGPVSTSQGNVLKTSTSRHSGG